VRLDPDGLTLRTLDRWVLLRGAEAAAEALPDSRRAQVATLRSAGDARRDAALGERGIAALILARAAIPLYLEAAVTARGEEPPPENAAIDTLWHLYDAIAERGLLPVLPAHLEAVRAETLTSKSPDDDVARKGEACTDSNLELGTFLARRLDARTPRRIRVERRLRQAGLAIVALFLLGKAAAHLPRSNVALHAPVVASSRRPGCGPPLDLTNGKVEGAVAFCTKDEPDPWVMLDFVNARRVDEITLMNSPDHEDDSLPLRVETSVDGANWAPGGTQSAHFSATAPAIITFSRREARFVRIHGRGGGAIYLTEVEAR
jgi:hypothetical protein